jgi:hypothetical protein
MWGLIAQSGRFVSPGASHKGAEGNRGILYNTSAMDMPTDTITHRVRTSILEQETVWRLMPDGLEREQVLKDGKSLTVRYPYRDIREIRLSFAPTRVDRIRYRCDFQLRNGTLVAILSTHYAGFASFEDRGATYGPLVRGLIERVAAANPACKFEAGKRPGTYWGEHIFLFLMVLLLVFVIGAVGGASLSTLVLVKLGILVFYVPVLILYTRKNWPRSFDPAAIPSGLMPDGGGKG